MANPPVDNPRFVPYKTMWKLGLATTSTPRKLECMHCGNTMEWRIYSTAPEAFDAYCDACGMSADDYWKDKPQSREVKVE